MLIEIAAGLVGARKHQQHQRRREWSVVLHSLAQE